MLIACKKDRSRILSVDVVEYGLFAHEFKSVYSQQVSRLKKLHHVLEGYLALVCVEIVQNFVKDIVLNLFELNVTSVLGCPFV